MFYLDLFHCLHERGVRYLLVGGLAMNMHGVPVRLCAIEDMIRLKEGTGRRQDADDVEHLRRIQALNGNA